MHDKLGIFLQNKRIDEVLKCLEGNVIDIGCGNNRLINKYKKIFKNKYSYGVDVHPWEGIDYKVKNSYELPFKENYFDCCAILASLNHIIEREKVLSEASRILKKRGKLIITMINPFIGKIWHKLRSNYDTDQIERGMVSGELYGLSKRQILDLCTNSYFNLISHRKFYVFNNIYIFINDK